MKTAPAAHVPLEKREKEYILAQGPMKESGSGGSIAGPEPKSECFRKMRRAKCLLTEEDPSAPPR